MKTVKAKKKKLAGYIGNRINLSSLESSLPVFRFISEQGQAALSEMAKALGLSRGTCNLHLQRLEHEQLVRRFKSVKHGAGRPIVIWGIDTPANLTLSLVFDVPFLHASLADFSLMPVLRDVFDLSDVSTKKEIQARIDNFLNRSKRQATALDAQIRQVAIYLPGLLDPELGRVRRAVNFPLLEGVDFKARISKAGGPACASIPLGLPFYFGESEHLPARSNNMIIYWDLGVGVVFGHGDRLCALGSDGRSGSPTLAELGHVRIRKGGRLCHCGNSGCLEAYVGGWAMIKSLNRKSVRSLNDFIQAVMQGDTAALGIAREATETLGRELAWPIQVMQTDRILVCGPLAPVFAMFGMDFRRGLGALFDSREVARLAPQATPWQEERFLRGAHRLAMRLFSRPHEYPLLLRPPSALTPRA